MCRGKSRLQVITTNTNRRNSSLVAVKVDTMTPSTTTGPANLPLASEFYKLSLLLSVSTAVNQDDVYPTFAARFEDKFLWREAKKLDNYSTVLDDATNILVFDHQILAGMAAGRCSVVLINCASNPVINREDKVYPGALDLGHCEVMPDGVDYWPKIKTTKNAWVILHSDKWVFEYTRWLLTYNLTTDR